MKLKTTPLFAVPETVDELFDMLDFPNGEEKALAMRSAMLAWNCAAHISNQPESDGDIA
tara:strand:+ start:123 stop:299 length:177 start_codon:yes stop_codon:yes gene_type:complete